MAPTMSGCIPLSTFLLLAATFELGAIASHMDLAPRPAGDTLTAHGAHALD